MTVTENEQKILEIQERLNRLGSASANQEMSGARLKIKTPWVLIIFIFSTFLFPTLMSRQTAIFPEISTKISVLISPIGDGEHDPLINLEYKNWANEKKLTRIPIKIAFPEISLNDLKIDKSKIRYFDLKHSTTSMSLSQIEDQPTPKINLLDFNKYETSSVFPKSNKVSGPDTDRPPAIKKFKKKTDDFSHRLLAIVDKSEQKVEIYRNGEKLYVWAVSTARNGKITPTGIWKARWLSRNHKSSLYNGAPMPFAIFYHGNFAIHGTDAIDRLGSPASAGCVRLHPQNAEILFSMVEDTGISNFTIQVIE